MEIILKPVGIVHNSRVQPDDDNWGEVVSEIFLEPHLPPESLQGINEFFIHNISKLAVCCTSFMTERATHITIICYFYIFLEIEAFRIINKIYSIHLYFV